MTDKLFDDLSRLANAYGLSLIDVLESCPHHNGQHGAILLEDLVDHIEDVGRMKTDLHYRAAKKELEEFLT